MSRTAALLVLLLLAGRLHGQQEQRPTARELGLAIGVFTPGTYNAITDIPGVLVGHVTLMAGDSVRTGVTAVLPHGGNVFQEKVEAAIVVGNGFGKLVGTTQVQELGQIETPIVLTNTLSVWEAANGVVDHMLSLPGNEDVRSINPVVGETNDGTLNDIRGRHVRRRHVLESIRTAASGPVAQGNVGAGTGTTAFGWKGGIGTSSRVLPPSLGGWSVGVLVQTNYGGILDIAGVPVGKELRRHSYRDETSGGSCMIVVATDAPLHSAQLARLAKRATLALGRTGSAMSNGSGDYVIAFSSTRSSAARAGTVIPDSRISPLFQAVVEATEEAIYNSLLKATSLRGYRASAVNALPIDTLTQILHAYGRLR